MKNWLRALVVPLFRMRIGERRLHEELRLLLSGYLREVEHTVAPAKPPRGGVVGAGGLLGVDLCREGA
jgi:hypothetical protein